MLENKEPRLDIFTFLMPYIRKLPADSINLIINNVIYYWRVDMLKLLVEEKLMTLPDNEDLIHGALYTPKCLLTKSSLPSLISFIDYVRSKKVDCIFDEEFTKFKSKEYTDKFLYYLVENKINQIHSEESSLHEKMEIFEDYTQSEVVHTAKKVGIFKTCQF